MSANTTAPAPRPARRQPVRLWRVPVSRVERVTPRMARVTVAAPELADFPSSGTDQNVMLYFYPDGVELPEPLTLESARAIWSRVRPMTRTYTIRRHDPGAGEIDFDFVLHGEHGLASAWAQQVRPGDQVIFVGPSPAYQPSPEVGTYLLAGDETALPAIAAILRALPAGTRALVFVEIADAGEKQPLPTDANAEITWLHRDGRPSAGEVLLECAVRDAEFSPDDTEAWIAGERAAVLAVRRHLLDVLHMPRHRVRPTTYWRQGSSGN
jgi:NADPH-dependent ferric siderophore reductase